MSYIPKDEEELRGVAWEVISRLTVSRLLEDCVEALVEAYQIDEDLYISDRQMLEEEDARDMSMPLHTYMSIVVEKEQEEEDVNVTE